MTSSKTDYDVAVIGAGINGVGAAQALAASGYRVALIERNAAPAMETSSKSSKLIHGGLRYLANGQWRLVRECLRERATLLRIAPSLVKQATFLIPVYKGRGHGRLALRLGLRLYRLLGGGDYCFHTADDLHAFGLNTDGLLGAFEYQDAQTDDQALTDAVCQSARALGVDMFFSSTVLKAQRQDAFELTLADKKITAQAIVNAAGPWVNHVVACIEGAKALPVDWVQGSHIIINRHCFDACVYLQTHDNRAVFVLPWKGRMLVGTTEKTLKNIADVPGGELEVAEDEVNYLLQVFNDNFPSLAVTQKDVAERFCGVRCLPASTKNTHAKSRDTLIDTQVITTKGQPAGGQYVAIYGGKLTAYRATAQKVVKALSGVPATGKVHFGGDTRQIVIGD